MNILLVNDTGGRENLGCRLTSTTLAQSLAEAFTRAGRAVRVTPAPWGFAPRLRLPDPALREALADPGEALSAPVLRAVAVAEYGEAAVAATEAGAAVVFQPEGTISDDHGAARVVRNLSLPLYAALHAGAPVAVTNGTFPLFDAGDGRADPIRLLLDRACHASLRDRPSASHWGAGFAPDAAVLWPGEKRLPGPGADHLLVTTAAEAPRERDLAIGRAALGVCRRAGLRPLVLTKAWERLAPLRGEVERLGGRIVPQASLDEADALLARCRLHLGGRYHMALMAATKGIPSALVRTNTHKNLWLAEEFDGIAVAPDADLAEAAEALLGVVPPRAALLAGVARCRAVQREEVGRLAEAVLGHRPEAGRPARLDPDAAAALARDAAPDGWGRRLRGWLGGRAPRPAIPGGA